ncbi:MAG: HD domain-containing protein [Clostridiales bacterium]|nr:HD domain-containing protein [Clostridiales bacterium]
MNVREEQILEVIKIIEKEGRFAKSKEHYQHGTTTVYQHCINVAVISCIIADKCGLHVNFDDLIRGALLHDYFLYDWHEKDKSHRLHGFCHPRKALRNAEEDFLLTAIEKDIIKHHMFPLIPIPPHTLEAWVVCLADKVCAIQEMVVVTQEKIKI